MKFPICITFIFIALGSVFAQQISTPIEKGNFTKVTSYQELTDFVQQLDKNSDLLNVETIGQTVQGRNLYALKFSASEFGKDKSKLKVLFLAQQHGNEQSGKEGALLIAQALLKPENKYLFDRIDLAIVPQMNPDGSETNQRRNGNNADLNRNHLIMSEPETRALHRFFDTYLFELTMDVHEYSPYSEDWEKYGYRKNTDETLGITTNPNVAVKIRELSKNEVFLFWLNYLNMNKFTSFVYCPGGPPKVDYFRHSTFDINDGRQSFGIQNTLSFIQEGMNGADNFVDNLKHRSEGQMTGMRGILEFAFLHEKEIKKMIADERKMLVSSKLNTLVSIQSEHVANGQKLDLPLYSYSTKNDTVVQVDDYRPVVKTLYDVQKPVGYLIPKKEKELLAWAANQSLLDAEYKTLKEQKIEQYLIKAIDSIDFERDIIINPIVETKEYQGKITVSDYVYIPTTQLKGNMVVLALEPKSELGLVTYKQYARLLNIGQVFPVLRVVKK